MRIFYHLSSYISHREAGLEYVRCLESLGHEVVLQADGLPGCSVVILHDDPLALPGILASLPDLSGKRVIAYCVWEGSLLPERYVDILAHFREIWTCSDWVRRTFASLPAKVRVLPHVVRRPRFSSDDLTFARHAVGEEGAFLFFSIVDGINPRKNLIGLLGAFNLARNSCRLPMRLVLKQYRLELNLSGLPGVCSLHGDYTSGQMAALHVVSGAYVSAHHAEGWGLGLSTAMAFGKPVIATGWSGNMEYMNGICSLPVPYELGPVSSDMCRRLPLFTPEMQWAEPDIRIMAEFMCRVAEGRIPEDLPRKAAAAVERFGPEAVGRRLQELLQEAHEEPVAACVAVESRI